MPDERGTGGQLRVPLRVLAAARHSHVRPYEARDLIFTCELRREEMMVLFLERLRTLATGSFFRRLVHL